MENCENCKNYIEEYMENNKISIDDLFGIDISEVEKITYGVDRCEISLAMYCLLWGDMLGNEGTYWKDTYGRIYFDQPEYLPTETIPDYGSKPKYSGESLNSYETISIWMKNNGIEIEENMKELEKSYRTLGNFIPFPVITEFKGKNISSLNSWKGDFWKKSQRKSVLNSSEYVLGDFADLFLMIVKQYYERNNDSGWIIELNGEPDGKEWREETEKVFKANKFYFDKFSDFRDYCEKNMFSDFLDENGDVQSYFNHRIGYPFSENLNSGVDKMNGIIGERGKIMLEKLKKKLNYSGA